MKKLVLMLTILASALLSTAAEPDILVTQTGESMKVYNVEFSTSGSVFYTLSEAADAPLQKIAKEDIMVIKRADGTIVNPNVAGAASPAATAAPAATASVKENPGKHEPVTFVAATPTFTEYVEKAKKKEPERVVKVVLAGDGEHPEVAFRLISEDDKTLAVTKRRYASEAEGKAFSKAAVDAAKANVLLTVVIPEYVKVGDDIYTVTEIDDEGLLVGFKWYNRPFKGIVTDFQFPETLKRIGEKACAGNGLLKRIILPESVEYIGKGAFQLCGTKNFQEIYLPKGVKEIGDHAFYWVGENVSYNKHYKGYLSCKPDWLTTGNCTRINIDEEAIENYEKQMSR